MLRIAVAGLLMGTAALAATNAPTTVTFNRDVLPILQKNCQTCHRPGEIAPMSFLSFKETRPWAKAIKEAVLTRKMPPWFADSQYGHFANERRLSDAEISTLVAWANIGAPEGDMKDRPAPIEFPDGWKIRPDIVVEMPSDFPLPATGTIDYQYILVKANFDRDLWVQAAEIRPGNRQVVHHMKAWLRPPGSHYMESAEPGVPVVPSQARRAAKAGEPEAKGTGFTMEGSGHEILAKYNPGLEPQTFTAAGSAKFIPKGSDIVFEIHYTTMGKPTSDRSKVGIMLAKAPPERRYFTSDSLTNHNFVLPAGDSNAEVREQVEVEDTVDLVWIQPHMHLRGKDYELRALYPTGEAETLLKAKFDFNWQLGYEFAKPVVLPKGTRLEGISHFDNSANNPFNPDPKIDVHYGPQNWDEMSVGFFGVVMDAKANPAKLFRRLPPPGGN